MREKFKKILLYPMLIAIGLLPGFWASAQQSKITARFDSTSIQIGDQIRLHFEIELPANAKVKMPQFHDTLSGKIEILKAFPQETSQKSGQLHIKQDLLVTSFDSGYYQVGPIAFPYEMGKVKDTLKTASLYLSVNTLPVDTTKGIRDIKPPLSVPFSLMDYWLYIAGLFGLIILIFAIWLIIKLFRKEPIFGTARAIEPPYVIALRELDSLRSEKLWQSEKTKLYYTRLTEIIRTYIEKRYEINALEMTSDEIIKNLRGMNIDDFNSIDVLQKMFSTADLVKFAKGLPLPDENEVNLLNAYQFVNNTKIVVSGIAEAEGDKDKKEGDEVPNIG
jgi:hypothetical protein